MNQAVIVTELTVPKLLGATTSAKKCPSPTEKRSNQNRSKTYSKMAVTAGTTEDPKMDKS